MEAAVHKRNLESSILFMQQEHAATLKALHEEIHKLQKKCTDLTFQLTMHGFSVEDEGEAADSQLQQVQQELREAQSLEDRLQTQLGEEAERLRQLEAELRTEKKRHGDEMRQAAQSISSLRAEVEAKSNNIAFLTTELHRLKVRQKAGAGGGDRVVVDAGPTIVRRTQPQYGHLPAPPRDMLTNSARMRHRGSSRPLPGPGVRRSVGVAPSVSSTGVGGGEAEALARSLRVTSASARSSGSESPVDISPFVHRDTAPSVVEVKKPAPLPPIAPSSHPGLGERDPHLDKTDLQHVAMAKRGRRAVSRPRSSPTPEVATLAVEPVSDTNWKRPSQSHSSEYN
ncbi:coiled-coil domain-containing protein 92-like [Babylonia areolata]|uniref:coiled-coil domain-containing protein 92-like n=1 Tax=Babylonia areolata TaxID=304850 RepID=UPI003FD16E56